MTPLRRMCTLRELRRGSGEAPTGRLGWEKASKSLCRLKTGGEEQIREGTL